MTSRTIVVTPQWVKFNSPHSLHCFGPGHPCANKHGHTWRTKATFAGEPDDHGVLIDFAVVRDVVGPPGKVLDHVDLDVMFDGKATGENILMWLVGELQERAARRPNCRLVRVMLLEDPVPGDDGHVLVWESAVQR